MLQFSKAGISAAHQLNELLQQSGYSDFSGTSFN